jgi:hypothetical protein
VLPLSSESRDLALVSVLVGHRDAALVASPNDRRQVQGWHTKALFFLSVFLVKRIEAAQEGCWGFILSPSATQEGQTQAAERGKRGFIISMEMTR